MPSRKPKPKSKSRRKPKKKAKPTPKAKVDPEFGIELRRRREEAGLSTAELAKLAGLSQSTVIVVEAGKRELRAHNRAKLLNVLEPSSVSGNTDMHGTNLDRAILAVERLALAAERIANALEKTKR